MVEKTDVAAVLELIRPSLQADGGDVKLVDVDEDGVVTVELQGACKGCPMSQMTLANGVERILKERVPGVTRVLGTQDGETAVLAQCTAAEVSACGARFWMKLVR